MESILLKAGVDIIKMSGYARAPNQQNGGGVLREELNIEALSIIRTRKRCCENVDYIRESICCN